MLHCLLPPLVMGIGCGTSAELRPGCRIFPTTSRLQRELVWPGAFLVLVLGGGSRHRDPLEPERERVEDAQSTVAVIVVLRVGHDTVRVDHLAFDRERDAALLDEPRGAVADVESTQRPDGPLVRAEHEHMHPAVDGTGRVQAHTDRESGLGLLEQLFRGNPRKQLVRALDAGSAVEPDGHVGRIDRQERGLRHAVRRASGLLALAVEQDLVIRRPQCRDPGRTDARDVDGPQRVHGHRLDDNVHVHASFLQRLQRLRLATSARSAENEEENHGLGLFVGHNETSLGQKPHVLEHSIRCYLPHKKTYVNNCKNKSTPF